MNRTEILQTIAEVEECVRVDLHRPCTLLEDCDVHRLSNLIQSCYFIHFPGEPTLPRSLIYHNFVYLMFMSANAADGLLASPTDCDDLLVLDQVLMETSTRFKQRTSMVSRVFCVLGHAFNLYPHVHTKFYQHIVGDKLMPCIVKCLARAMVQQHVPIPPCGLREHLNTLKRIDGKRWKRVEPLIRQAMREWFLVHKLCEDHLPAELVRLVWLGF